MQIVVVDASPVGSEDAVAAIDPTARYVHAPHLAGWMTRSRNEALLHVDADVISFIDDDVVVRPGWDRALMRAFADLTVDAVGGRTCNDVPGDDVYDRPIGRLLDDGTLTAGFGAARDEYVEIDHGIGANMSFRREVLAELGGFRDDYPGTAMREDTDVFLRVRRLGRRVIFAPDAVVDHLPAPHVHGKRFDRRYQLYGLRNHMVLLARHEGIRSTSIRRYVARQYRGIMAPTSFQRRVKRFLLLTAGVAWGGAAMLVSARWNPLPAARYDVAGRRIREALDR